MWKIVRVLAAVWLVLLGTAAGRAAVAQSAAPIQVPEKATDRIERLERQVRELEKALAEARAAGGLPADRIAEVERRIEILSRELEALKLGEAAEAAESVHGLGPAASKVYRTRKGVSLGGYGEILYAAPDSRRDDGMPSGEMNEFDLLRAVAYIGYKFNDRILFNSEIEFEHATTGEGSEERGEASLEFAYLDFLCRETVNVRAGLLLLPVGFINELHEPPTFLGARRPDVERAILPTTWRENGLGLFGDAGPVSWRAYLVAGLDGAGLQTDGFSADGGLRGGRQSGSQSLAEDWAFVGRADWRVVPGLTLGTSLYTGDSGQGAVAPSTGRRIAARTDIVEAHGEWRFRGLEVRALWARAEVDDAALLNEFKGLAGSSSIGRELTGSYLQVGYDLLSARQGAGQALIPYVRIETYDTQRRVPGGFARDPAHDVDVTTVGVAWKPLVNIAVKADWQDIDDAAGTGTDRFNVALGWLF